MTNQKPIIDLKLPDFSFLTEVVKSWYEKMRPITEAAQAFQERLLPIVEAISSIQSNLPGILKNISEAMQPLVAVNKLGEAQFVYWSYMSEGFVDDIISADNVNKILRGRIEQDRFRMVNDIIDTCSSHWLMTKYKRLFSQSVFAFRNGKSDLSVIGLISIIDGLLTDVSGSYTTNIFNRATEILDKLEREETIDNREYALLILSMTFQMTVETFSASVSFSGKEPKGLNRHWIMHGRSCRKKTKLDCIKLIRFIYGIILIDELSRNESLTNGETEEKFLEDIIDMV